MMPRAEGRSRAMNEQTDLMTAREAARFLGFAPETLKKRRLRGEPPSYFKLGKAVRYRREDLEQFLSDCRVNIGAGDE
jgi:predicted DNA-binding transcriptional regulator AlpA